MNPYQELSALNAAYNILDDAAGAVAGQASIKPFLCVRNAREYIRKQADELLAPVFSGETINELDEMVERVMLPKGQLTDRQISDGVMASLAASDRGVQGPEE